MGTIPPKKHLFHEKNPSILYFQRSRCSQSMPCHILWQRRKFTRLRSLSCVIGVALVPIRSIIWISILQRNMRKFFTIVISVISNPFICTSWKSTCKLSMLAFYWAVIYVLSKHKQCELLELIRKPHIQSSTSSVTNVNSRLSTSTR